MRPRRIWNQRNTGKARGARAITKGDEKEEKLTSGKNNLNSKFYI